MSKSPCGCYYGDICTPSSLCAVQSVEEERDALAARIEKLEAQVKEYVEQAEQGIWAEHQCPAFFACAFIVADSSPKDAT